MRAKFTLVCPPLIHWMNLQGTLTTVTFQAMVATEDTWPDDQALIQAWASPATLWGVELWATPEHIDRVRKRVTALGALVADDENGAAAVFRHHGIF